MSRDHYKGTRKTRAAVIDADGNIGALSAVKDDRLVVGTATLSAGTVTISGSEFVSDAIAFISTKHPYPTTEGTNWFVGDGYLTISGSNAASYTVGYQVFLP